MSEDYVRMAQKVHIERDEATLRLKFPDPTWPPGVSGDGQLVRLDDASFGYNKEEDTFLLRNITLHLSRRSKVALVGKNGAGKSTLVKWICGELERVGKTKGEVWKANSTTLPTLVD